VLLLLQLLISNELPLKLFVSTLLDVEWALAAAAAAATAAACWTALV